MKSIKFILCLMVVQAALANDTLSEQHAHALAVDDVYKLAVQGKTTYKDFQQACYGLTVEQIHAKLAGLDVQALHSVNNARLTRYEKCLDRCVGKPVENMQSVRQPSTYNEIVKDNAALKLAKQRQDMAIAKLQTRSARYAAPDLRFKALQKNYRKNNKRAILGAIGSAALMSVGGYATYHNVAPYGQEFLTVVGLFGFLGSASLSGVDAATDPAFYFNEKADHARRKELIDQLCKK